eukprot:TRINITY_DN226_c0_g2_i3.p1 TRINITY_DN226_c0_g2~~TRINITY_DN226_c0_g2_i3.p1  ORF type:complete len:286 (+),score=56.46 TRINITY_DN226_c0_g2_i3:37-894(+)
MSISLFRKTKRQHKKRKQSSEQSSTANGLDMEIKKKQRKFSLKNYVDSSEIELIDFEDNGVLNVRVLSVSDNVAEFCKGHKGKIFYLGIGTSFVSQRFRMRVTKRGVIASPTPFSFVQEERGGLLTVYFMVGNKYNLKEIGKGVLDLTLLPSGKSQNISVTLHFDEDLGNGFCVDRRTRYKVQVSLFFQEKNHIEGESVRFHDLYEMNDLIGKGGFASVYRVTHKDTNQVFAVKKISLKNKTDLLPSLHREIDIMSRLKSKYIIELKETFEEEDTIYMVQELFLN